MQPTADLSILTLVANASLVVKCVLAILVFLSLASWTVIFQKYFTISRAMRAVYNREMDHLERSLPLLASIGSTSPYIGLFGTVWGIMNAFGRIAAAGNTNLTTVAPAIAEALFATAIGLAAAIPAYIAYNKFSIDAGKFTGRLESFADDLQAAVARRLGGGSAPVPPPPPSPSDLGFRRSV